jgi:hypothetical protein
VLRDARLARVIVRLPTEVSMVSPATELQSQLPFTDSLEPFEDGVPSPPSFFALTAFLPFESLLPQ